MGTERLSPLGPPPRAAGSSLLPSISLRLGGPSAGATLGGANRRCQPQVEGRARYGPVWKASFGPILTVHVAEAELIEQVLRQEGPFPVRSQLSSWKDYRRCRGHSCGLLTA